MLRIALPLVLMLAWGACGPAFAMRTIHNQFNNQGPTDPVKIQCAAQVGATFDWGVHHYTGSPQVMGAWKRCVGGR